MRGELQATRPSDIQAKSGVQQGYIIMATVFISLRHRYNKLL
ncbi:hypothetical protein Xenpb_00965 [Xenorhabdus sp. PB62.4]|nr:hypothetical protein [Xenorhabdus sp. PB62.4]